MLQFNDGNEWLQQRISGVQYGYLIPDDIDKGICVDIGANVGAFPVLYHEKFKKIYSIEPANSTFEILKQNIVDYQITNVDAYQYAVSDNDGEIVKLRHYKDDSSSGNATTLDDPIWYRDGEYEDVETISIDGILNKFKIDKIEYLKIDCEGGEYKFLMNKDLSKIKYIGIEIHLHLGEKAKELINFLCNSFDIIDSKGDGETSHIEMTLKNKNLI